MTRASGAASPSSIAAASSSRSCGVMVLYSAARGSVIAKTPGARAVRRGFRGMPGQSIRVKLRSAVREWGKTLALCALLACSGQPRVRAVSLSASTTQVAAALGLAEAVTPIDPRAPDALSRALASGTQLVLAD